jgi:hypothetical protein
MTHIHHYMSIAYLIQSRSNWHNSSCKPHSQKRQPLKSLPLTKAALVCNRINANRIPTSHNSHIAYKLQRNDTEHSICMDVVTLKPQQALYVSLTLDRFTSKSYPYKTWHSIVPIRYRGSLVIYTYITQAWKVFVVICYIDVLLRILLHVSIISISHSRTSNYHLQCRAMGSVLLENVINKSHSSLRSYQLY